MLDRQNKDFWTTERLAALKKMWADGASATVICNELGAASRSAICGKIFRLGLATRRQNRQPTVRKARAPRAYKPVPQRVYVTEQERAEAITELPPEDTTNTIAFMDLGTDTCRWPIGNASSLDTIRFCGKPRDGERPYCLRHCSIAYRQPGDR